MKPNKAAEKALVAMLDRTYREIREVEERWDVRGDDGDYRPRIEYFHDAVRAFTESDGRGSADKGRLSVEFLAYDISMLRHIQQEPFPGGRKGKRLSSSTDVAENNLPRVQGDKSGFRPTAEAKLQLIDYYKNYAVLFAALLASAADYNYQSRMHDCNAEVEDIAGLINNVAAKAKYSDAAIDLAGMADAQINTADVMNKLLAAFHNGKLKKTMAPKEALKKLKETAQQTDKEQKAIEQAHFTFATSQLAVYEGARDVIKKMAVKGFNIVGDFVESAVAEARRGSREM